MDVCTLAKSIHHVLGVYLAASSCILWGQCGPNVLLVCKIFLILIAYTHVCKCVIGNSDVKILLLRSAQFEQSVVLVVHVQYMYTVCTV